MGHPAIFSGICAVPKQGAKESTVVSLNIGAFSSASSRDLHFWTSTSKPDKSAPRGEKDPLLIFKIYKNMATFAKSIINAPLTFTSERKGA
jgi:hypothetical protein